ncbi:nucleolar complex protein 3 homolog [Peromyscus leucopus]|uniref:nucleolar complex protein 3 homolog n=1 Tax=Peromyscus leucopus TaxID=10041 RepID=UPI0010A0C94E|nr:nucleolar complex protein 3 homolog [Peromyscus leucopus]
MSHGMQATEKAKPSPSLFPRTSEEPGPELVPELGQPLAAATRTPPQQRVSPGSACERLSATPEPPGGARAPPEDGSPASHFRWQEGLGLEAASCWSKVALWARVLLLPAPATPPVPLILSVVLLAGLRMKARRNKKQVPSFRKLIKTSKVKLENKLKNKQFKQQSTIKKYRKEQRKLRQAVKDAVSKKPIPLEDPKSKRPVKRMEREEEEEEEALPLDMMDEDDLQLMKDLGQKASFLTRDLSSSEPVHIKKRKHESVIDKYEKMPRTLQTAPEKELIHLLPIKDKSGIIPQTREKPVTDIQQEEEDEEELQVEEEVIESPRQELTLEEHLIERKKKLQEKKIQIAALASAILSDPESNIKKLKELRSMLMEQDPDVAVTVRKLVIISLMELFKDITPSYKIRPLTEAEKSTKIRKETQKLREFEEGLVSQYKFYLENLEQMVKDWKQRKLKKSNVVSLKAYKGLAEVAVKSLCELLVALPHFNFHNNIIVLIVPLMNDGSKLISEMCCEAVKKLFKQDKLGQASLGVIKVISGFVKGRNYEVRPEMLKTFLCLRIKEVEVKKDTEDINKPKKFMTFKEKRKTLSRMQRKWKKAEEKLERELREAEASESTERKLKLHTETLNIVFVTYFRILKKAQRSPLLPAVLEGLAKFAHLINVEFFDDLLVVLHTLIESGDLSYQESLHCVQTAFHILSGQGDVLNIDPMKFYTHLYKTLFKLHAGATNDGIEIVLHCLDVMLSKRRKQVSHQRALAFIKRLCTLALQVLPNSSIGLLATTRILMHTFPRTDLLLDNESQGSGVFLPELEEPEYCNAQNTALWELHTLRRHYHPVVKRFATHLLAGAPSEGSEALKPELSRRSAVELFETYSMAAMTFNPPVEPSNSKKKDKFLQGDSFLNEDLNQLIKRYCNEVATEIPLDFAKCLKTSLQ